MRTPYAHQQRFLDKNPSKALLVWETGTGKTDAACMWLLKRSQKKVLVVCPKAIIEKWERSLLEYKIPRSRFKVVSRDEVKKTNLLPYRVLILDEAQDFASPLFTKDRSARATIIYTFLKDRRDVDVLLLTATPIRSTPWNIHTLSCYLSRVWPVKVFQNEYFRLTNKFGRMHYEKNYGWQKAIRPKVEMIADIVLMQDCVDVPIQHSQIVKIPWTPEQENELGKQYLEPAAEWHARHRLENGKEKFEALKKIIDGYRKVIVVCHYRSQIAEYEKLIGEDRFVITLHGGILDQDDAIKEAREADDCVFIIQASMGAGFDAAEFSVVVFASMSFKYVDYIQMKGRVKRINNLHENTFIHLLGGKCDQAVYDQIQKNRDFDVHDYLAGSPGHTKEA